MHVSAPLEKWGIATFVEKQTFKNGQSGWLLLQKEFFVFKNVSQAKSQSNLQQYLVSVLFFMGSNVFTKEELSL